MDAKACEELAAWQQAKCLADMIHELIKRAPLNVDYGLCDRIWKSSLSIMFTIAKGFESPTNREFVARLGDAKRSVGQIESHLCHIFDQRHIDKKEFEDLHDQAMLVSEEIAQLIADLKGRRK